MVCILLQRAKTAQVIVEGACVADMPQGGLVLFVGLGVEDIPFQETMAQREVFWTKLWLKIAKLRVFSDHEGKMNLSLLDKASQACTASVPQQSSLTQGLMVVSQFTLYAECMKGHRPSFTEAMPPAMAGEVFHHAIDVARATLPSIPIYTGVFGANMQVELINDGPVTLMLSF
ncbi:MAG: D-aminoacyl-tRNA deacylase [Vampirovibrionales bacterium]